MKAFTANKDTLFSLAGLQKEIIFLCNKKHGATSALPEFPLWAFYDDSIELKKASCSSCRIGCACLDEKERLLYFPVEIIFAEGDTVNIRINFARVSDAVTRDDLAPYKETSLALPSFRTGSVLLKNNAWEFFDEQWVKVK